MTNPASLRFPVVLSVIAALVTMGMKMTAYVVTGSVGLLSDALESGVNLVAAVTALVALWYAARPVDANHPYGHEKIVFFSSGLEGLLIIAAGAGMALYAVERLVENVPLQQLGLGTGLTLGASLINFAVARVLLRAGRAHESIVLEADGKHLMTDVWTSVAVVAGLGVAWLTGVEELDPLIAIGMAANIAFAGAGLIRRSFNGLMDHALPDEELDRLRGTIEARLPDGASYHALRTRLTGGRRLADFHLLVPGSMSVRSAHALAEHLEADVEAVFPGMELTIHIEPLEEDVSWRDNRLAGIEPTHRPADDAAGGT